MANYKRWSFPRIVHFNGKSRFGINMLYVNHKGDDTPWREDRRLFTVISKMKPCGIESKLRLYFAVLTCSNRKYICFHGYIQYNKFSRTDSVASSVKMAEYVFKALMGENIGMLNIYFDTCLLSPQGLPGKYNGWIYFINPRDVALMALNRKIVYISFLLRAWVCSETFKYYTLIFFLSSDTCPLVSAPVSKCYQWINFSIHDIHGWKFSNSWEKEQFKIKHSECNF